MQTKISRSSKINRITNQQNSVHKKQPLQKHIAKFFFQKPKILILTSSPLKIPNSPIHSKIQLKVYKNPSSA